MSMEADKASAGDSTRNGEPLPLPREERLVAPSQATALAAFVGAGAILVAVALWWNAGRDQDASVTAARNTPPPVISMSGDEMKGAFQVMEQTLVTDRPHIVNSLKMTERERQRLREELKAGRVRIAAVSLWDNYDEDADVVAISSAGFAQQLEIRHQEQMYFVPIVPGGSVHITAVTDGGGGGVTLGVKSVFGNISLPALAPGQTLEVPAL